MKVLVAMSGGVDSSVAAALLQEQGHDVTGVHLRLADMHGADDGGRIHGCCGLTDAEDARRVAQVLDIPFYVWNMKDVFAREVVDDFAQTYADGRTPNPCVRCNEKVKFGALDERARTLGFDAVATGHYARITRDADGRWRLRRGRDEAKDQSYVLARMTQETLGRTLFPLGELTKPEVRAHAADLALRTANKPESYDICFVPDGDQAAFVSGALADAAPAPGAIVDASGAVLGSHEGIHRFTIGQRRGLGLGGSEPRFVTQIDAAARRVVVGPADMLARAGLVADEVVWCGGEPPVRVGEVQVRAHGAPLRARLITTGATVTIAFTEPQRGIAPGQLVAFCDGDEVLGGGTIARSLGADDPALLGDAPALVTHPATPRSCSAARI